MARHRPFTGFRSDDEHMDLNRQQAPFPQDLSDLVDELTYKPGWTFDLVHLDRGQGSEGLTLDILTDTVNSYHHEQTHYRVHHYMIVPTASYNRQSWQRWLLDQILLVEQHEACEFLTVNGVKPFAPRHGPGNDPYAVVEYADDVERRTSFRGLLKDKT